VIWRLALELLQLGVGFVEGFICFIYLSCEKCSFRIPDQACDIFGQIIPGGGKGDADHVEKQHDTEFLQHCLILPDDFASDYLKLGDVLSQHNGMEQRIELL
jgi:hypothetical protein